MAVCAAVLLTLMGLGCEFLIWPDWDAAWLLAIARRMRAGATLYSDDLVEINPPTIIEFARLALRLSDVLGVEAITAWRLLVFAFVQLSLGLSLPLLHRGLRGNDAHLFLPAAVLLAAVLGCLPGANFGQREHLILLFSLPYVLAAGLHISGNRLTLRSRVAYGAMLATALSIKPHYALLVLFVEAGVVLCVRRPWAWLRVETVSALAIAMVAALSIALRYPSYSSFAVPLALRFYGEYGEVQLSLSHAAYPDRRHDRRPCDATVRDQLDGSAHAALCRCWRLFRVSRAAERMGLSAVAGARLSVHGWWAGRPSRRQCRRSPRARPRLHGLRPSPHGVRRGRDDAGRLGVAGTAHRQYQQRILAPAVLRTEGHH